MAGDREAFVGETTLFGHTLDDLVVGALEVDHAGDVISLHWFPPWVVMLYIMSMHPSAKEILSYEAKCRPVESIKIYWPGYKTTTRTDVLVNRTKG